MWKNCFANFFFTRRKGNFSLVDLILRGGKAFGRNKNKVWTKIVHTPLKFFYDNKRMIDCVTAIYNNNTHYIFKMMIIHLNRLAAPIWTCRKTSLRWPYQGPLPSHTTSHVEQTSWRSAEDMGNHDRGQPGSDIRTVSLRLPRTMEKGLGKSV